ncbi:ras GTPase-activating-like protein IQGAP1 [Acipenser ruthenus]|uniref:ras GTPase-activating-like protein IQGAP1 n=1 Tax=Acipenser ruthenus TaxID=7906 RepID=UPI0027420571|nr:ras GTPase-activating-like protein IQGAP1 [Acipenser ruthenus]
MEGGQTRSGYERLTAEEMDEQRIQSVAYQYLCHLEEAKRWMEACLNEELPAPTELEEGLRNGVLLAKLGHCFAPHIVPLKKIYDCQQERYKATGLHFRHTDNINHWRNAMAQVGLPSIFHPETTDIYDKKNMPRAVYCIHALSLYLFRLGLAPQIQDLYGKVKFTEEEINNMKRELDKYGIQLPAFSKIGGILAGELSVDEAAVHAAVIAINEAVERGSVEDTALALRNPNAMLLNLSECLAPVYQEMLHQARAQKSGSARNRYKPDASQEKDIYEEYLTQAEIQGNINQVNVSAALERVDDALDMRDGPALHAALHSPSLALRGLHRELSHWYLEQLALQRQHKALDLGCVEPLDREELQEGVSTANENAQHSHATEQAVSRVHAALRRGIPRETVKELMDPEAELPDVYPFAAELYQRELTALQAQNPQGVLLQEELFVAVEMLSAVALINQALEAGDANGFWRALISPAAGLADIEEGFAQRYFDELCKLRTAAPRQGTALLSWNELQAGLNNVNLSVQEEHDLSLGLAAVNQAVKEGRSSQTLNVLLLPALGFCSVVPECAPHYQSELAALMKARLLQGENRSPWVRHMLRESGSYYFHLHNFQGTWEQPKGFIQNSTHLSRDEIQSILTQVSAAHDRDCLWRASEPFITRLQARGRGYLLRTQLATRRHFLRKQLPAVLAIQSHWRRYLQQRRYQQRLQFLRENTHAALKIQACARMWLARRRYLARLRHFRSNVKSVIKIQAFFRANKAREDYRMLVGRQAPPLSVVRRFAHLLERGEADLLQERELLRLREEVVRSIRANQGLESDLAIMDLKIGLLVRNRITLQEVVSHCKKLTRKNKEQLSDMMALDKQKGLKSLSKEKREKLEAYQHLFYLLQTQPIFLSRLIFQMPVNKSTRFMESVIFTVYNYASDSREACLLLQLFSTALQEEIRSRVDRIQDIVTGNPTVIRLLVSFYRNARGQNALREILGPPIKEVLQDKTLNIQTDPVDIYKSWINQTESQTGQRSSLPYAVTPEQALSHAEVQRRLDIAVRSLKSMTDRFLHAITSNLDSLPYGMRYTAKVLKDSLLEKFADATEEEVYKIVGNLLYYRYMNPAVVAPDGFDIVDYSAGVVLHPDHRRTLGSIARVLQHAAANKLFQGDSAHLRSLNDYISHTHLRFRRFLRAACEVPSPEERFSVDEYSEMVTLNKPVIYITIAELINTHKLLLEHRDSVAPDHTAPLHELLADLGDVPTVHSLAGEGVGNLSDPDAEQTLAQCSRMEISLTLTNKFDIFKDDEDKPDARGLMLSTKHLIIDVIRTQPGDSLPLLLRTSASEDQEAEHWRMMQRRALRDARTPEKMKRNKSIVADDNLSLEEKKRKIHRNLRKLEAMGALHYQSRFTEILTDIAKDIRNQRRYRQRRQAELVKLRHTLQGLNCKSAFHSEQIDYYNQYIKTCLDKLAARGRVNGKKAGEGRGKQVKPASLNYTAARLYEKGVLLEIEDLPISQFKNVIFDIIPCEEGGTFQVKARFMGVDMEKFPLHYQDLLQLQYEGVAVMKMFHKAKVNVNLLIFLLNKKFFKK